MHEEEIQHNSKKIPWLEASTMACYMNVMRFIAGGRHTYIQEWWDPQKKWLTTEFQMEKEEVDYVVQEWLTKWKVPVANDQLSAKMYQLEKW